ncbi:LOW QUALITY PROTEIN: CD2 antigen cytoplasmic tail-binding protein 2 homolog [Drosophila nasuta]|uniref:LOW QUALITY PROTEIN: CD2 antigen cytoplasmic tail-binding protein 2 homolog n=1 Tax=Drosophila nasuta TaxID=42062 RepID=UPI00295EF8E1|nr:LOW QUALITY PROTEIN: CD2 antigen cytoplasmic tail-binding protein 2 homolog [Drosophila nasuta]
MASKRKQNFSHENSDMFKKKHTLDSDEEDSDDYERENLNDSDIEGGEEGVGKVVDDVKITPFNMREELEEGHFDKDGHYHWNKDTEIKDNWLDNIDWVKVENDKNYFDPNNEELNGAGDGVPSFNLAASLRKMIEFMKAGESVQMALQRLGRKRPKLSTLEKLKQKKAGIENIETQQIAKLTEVANEILSNTGNMDIYQETYEKIMQKLENLPGPSKPVTESFDMYADDFEEKESKRLKTTQKKEEEDEPKTNEIKWEFKWKQADENIQGPYSTETMLNWSTGDYFKDGVYVRKVGENSSFYSSNRIDFDLYL